MCLRAALNLYITSEGFTDVYADGVLIGRQNTRREVTLMHTPATTNVLFFQSVCTHAVICDAGVLASVSRDQYTTDFTNQLWLCNPREGNMDDGKNNKAIHIS